MISLPQIQSKLLTHSRRSCFNTCRRKHYYRYELGIVRDREATPLRFGSAYHLGLERLAAGDDVETAVATACAGYEELPDWCKTDEDVTEWTVERETVAALIRGYAWRWSEDDAKIVANEFSFAIPIRNPETGAPTPSFVLAGKVDKIIRRGPRLGIREHKTTGESIEPDSDYWRRLAIDSQISGYMRGARESGYPVEFIEYDVVRKPGISPRKLTKAEMQSLVSTRQWFGRDVAFDPTALPERETPEMFGARLLHDIGERPDFYFARREIPRLDSDMADFEHELWQDQQLIRDCQRLNRWSRNTSACLLMGRCEFADLCFNSIDPTTDAMPSGYTRTEDVHPELEIQR